MGKSIKGVSSSIRDNIKGQGHSASCDNFCITDKTNNEFDLRVHESPYN